MCGDLPKFSLLLRARIHRKMECVVRITKSERSRNHIKCKSESTNEYSVKAEERGQPINSANFGRGGFLKLSRKAGTNVRKRKNESFTSPCQRNPKLVKKKIKGTLPSCYDSAFNASDASSKIPLCLFACEMACNISIPQASFTIFCAKGRVELSVHTRFLMDTSPLCMIPSSVSSHRLMRISTPLSLARMPLTAPSNSVTVARAPPAALLVPSSSVSARASNICNLRLAALDSSAKTSMPDGHVIRLQTSSVAARWIIVFLPSNRSSIRGKARRTMVSAASGGVVDARFVRARRASNVGSKSRGPSAVWSGSSVRSNSNGRMEEVNGGDPDEKTKAGSNEMRMRASAWAAPRRDWNIWVLFSVAAVYNCSSNLTPPCWAIAPRWAGVLESDRKMLSTRAIAAEDEIFDLSIPTRFETTAALMTASQRRVTALSSSRGSGLAGIFEAFAYALNCDIRFCSSDRTGRYLVRLSMIVNPPNNIVWLTWPPRRALFSVSRNFLSFESLSLTVGWTEA